MQQIFKVRVTVALAALLTGAAAIAVYSRAPLAAAAQAPAAQPQGIPVKAAPVKLGTVSHEVTAVGTLLANESVMIRPEIAGRVTAIHFTEGQSVAAGARLVTIDPAEYHAQLKGSSADAKLNAQRFERAEELYKKGFISSQALDEARGNLAKSSARQLEDQVRLNKTEIRAPFSGVVGLRKISPGAYVQPAQDIARLEDISSLKLDFRVPEVYLDKIRRDQEVAIRVDAYPREQFRGRIYALEPVVDEQTRTVLLRARVPNTNGKLRPGMFARVNLMLGQRTHALLVPEEAIVPRGQDSFVFRVVDGKALLTKVELGSRSPGEVEIVKGLTAGDTVVTDGQIKLRDGAAVMVLR